MDIKNELSQKRAEYISKYGRSPNTIFIGNNLIDSLYELTGGQSLYDAAPKHLWGADVIMVLTPNHIKFAEIADVKEAALRFHNDKSWNEYTVKKFSTSIGGVGAGVHKKPERIEEEPITFTSEELDIYLMQS